MGGLRPPFFSNRTPMLCIGYAKSAPDEGFPSAERTPHPSSMLRISATLSHKWRGKSERHLSALSPFGFPRWNQRPGYAFFWAGRRISVPPWENAMSLGTILIILVIIYLLGGFSGRFGGYGYGMGHSRMGLGGVILVVLLVLLLLGKL